MTEKDHSYFEIDSNQRHLLQFNTRRALFQRSSIENLTVSSAPSILRSILPPLRSLLHQLQRIEGWLIVALVAISTALSADWIETSTGYLSDVRFGVCQGMPWLDRVSCCGSFANVDFIANSCIVPGEIQVDIEKDQFRQTRWLSWSSMMNLPSDTPSSYIVNYVVFSLHGCILATLAAWLCWTFSREAAGSGIPEVKVLLATEQTVPTASFLAPWTCLTKCIGLCLSCSSGLAAGKEGPLVHISCCWAHAISNLIFRVTGKEGEDHSSPRELFSAASAIGVAVAFGAPLGGVLFALEEVATSFPRKTLWRAFFGAVVGALTIASLDVNRNLTVFQMDSISFLGSWRIVELIPFACIGLLGGALGTLFNIININWMKRKEMALQNKTTQCQYIFPLIEVLIVSCSTALLNYPFPLLRLSHSFCLQKMFSRCGLDQKCEEEKNGLALLQLGIAMVILFIETVFTFGIMTPAGLFVPSLTIGALLGRFVGILMSMVNRRCSVVHTVHLGVYAIIGAASVLGGVTRITIAIVVILFELTGGLSYIVPYMIAVMLAKWVAEFISPKSIYEEYIELRNLNRPNRNPSSSLDVS